MKARKMSLVEPEALAAEQRRLLIAQIERQCACIALNDDVAFLWRAQSFDLEHVERMTYQCEGCGADWKDTAAHLAVHFVEHLRTCDARSVKEA